MILRELFGIEAEAVDGLVEAKERRRMATKSGNDPWLTHGPVIALIPIRVAILTYLGLPVWCVHETLSGQCARALWGQREASRSPLL